MSFEICQVAALQYAKENKIPMSPDEIGEFAYELDSLRKTSLTRAELDVAFEKFVAKQEELALNENFEEKDSLFKAAQMHKIISVDNKGKFNSSEHAAFVAITGNPVETASSMNREVRAMAKNIEKVILDQEDIALAQDRQIIESGGLDKEYGTALVQMQDGLPVTVTNPAALRIATSLNSVINRAFEIKRGLNPTIEKATGYMMKQIHNREKMRVIPSDLAVEYPGLSAKEVWVEWMQRNYTIDGVKLPLEEAKRTLSEMYDSFLAGHQENVPRGGDIRRKYSKDRTLIPNSPEAFVDYQRMYGAGTLFDTVNQFIAQIAFDTAKMDKFGSNPELTLAQFTKLQVAEMEPGQVPAYLASVKNGMIRKAFDEVLGYNRSSPSWSTPGVTGFDSFKQKAAYSMAAARTFTWGTHGGMSAVRSLADVGLTPGLLRTMGEVQATAADVTATYANGLLDQSQRKEFFHVGGVLAEGAIRDNLSKAGLDSVPGSLSFFADKVSKYSGLQLHIDNLKSLVGQTLATGIARDVEVPWSELPKGRRQALERYGIGELEMGVYKQAIEEHNDVKFVNGGTVFRNLSDEVVGNYIEAKYPGMPIDETTLFRMRLELSNNIGGMINQAADMATSTPTTPDLLLSHWGIDQSTFTGQLIAMFMQFKAPAISLFRSLRRVYEDGKFVGSQANLALTASSVIGYTALADALISGFRGEEPRGDAKYLAGLAARTIAPIYVDIAAREFFEKEGFDPFRLPDLVGPAAGMTMDAAKLPFMLLKEGANAALGDKVDLTNEASLAAGLVSRSVPLRNLPYTIYLFNHFVDYPLKTLADSHKLSKMKKAFHKQAGIVNDERQYLLSEPGEHGLLGTDIGRP